MTALGHLAGRRPARHRPPRRPVRLAPGVGLHGRPGHARGPLSVRRLRRAAATRGVGPGRRDGHRPTRGAAPRRHLGRHDPRSRPLSVSSSPGPTRKKGGGRVGELDEEMVYESRVGDVFTLGTSSWRIEDITRDRVLVSPAPGVPGRLPFWKGDQLGRPLELGRALGAFLREVGSLTKEDARLRLVTAGLDAWAADNVPGVPRRAARGLRPHPRRPHHRGRALPRRAG